MGTQFELEVAIRCDDKIVKVTDMIAGSRYAVLRLLATARTPSVEWGNLTSTSLTSIGQPAHRTRCDAPVPVSLVEENLPARLSPWRSPLVNHPSKRPASHKPHSLSAPPGMYSIPSNVTPKCDFLPLV
jgi:hypothetical protein